MIELNIKITDKNDIITFLNYLYQNNIPFNNKTLLNTNNNNEQIVDDDETNAVLNDKNILQNIDIQHYINTISGNNLSSENYKSNNQQVTNNIKKLEDFYNQMKDTVKDRNCLDKWYNYYSKIIDDWKNAFKAEKLWASWIAKEHK